VKVATRRRARQRAAAPGAARFVPPVRLVAAILAVGLGAFLLGYAITAFVFFPGRAGGIVAVPDVREMPVGEARRALERLGLQVEEGGEIPNPRLPAGAVLMQTPLPGEEVARGSEVRLILSSGQETRTIPALHGRRAAEARALLEQMGWVVEVSEAQHHQAEGTVLEVRPAPGTELAVGSTVELVVSAGPPRLEVPEVTGFTVGDARTRLQAVGLRLGSVGYDPFAAVPMGTIVGQEPEAGASLPMGGAVRVVVAGYDPSPPPTDDPWGDDDDEAPGPEPGGWDPQR
jgi:beta-lactam-binding protein with PASTA domain